ncbi:MAG: hypothetical protein MI892_24595 [Desulfobacterales bacterium]|nr:hypothetical protein [Desulfobacterales bacterium]
MDFSDGKYPLGLFFIFVGIYSFWKGRNSAIKEKKAFKNLANKICIECKTPYPLNKEAPLVVCPKCNQKLVTLEDFLKNPK